MRVAARAGRRSTAWWMSHAVAWHAQLPGRDSAGTDGRGPQSEHRRQSITRYPRFVPSVSRLGWSLAGAPLAGGPGRSASSLLRLHRHQPSVRFVALARRPLHTRSMLDARSFMISTLERSQVGFLAAAVAHAAARLRLSRLELSAPPAATRLLRALSFRFFAFELPSSRRGEALWEREVAGLGSLGVASSETAAGSVRLRGCGLSRPRIRSFGSGAAAVEPAADSVVARSCAGCVGGFGWL